MQEHGSSAPARPQAIDLPCFFHAALRNPLCAAPKIQLTPKENGAGFEPAPHCFAVSISAR